MGRLGYQKWGSIRLHVECDAGHRGEQTPRVLQIGDRKVPVAEVLDAWLAPDHALGTHYAREGLERLKI